MRSLTWKKILPRSPSAPQDAEGRTEAAVDVALDGAADGVTVTLGDTAPVVVMGVADIT